MRERFRHDAALRLLLEAIVANGGRGVERLLDVARVELFSSHPRSVANAVGFMTAP